MKRTVQMKNSGIPVAGSYLRRFKGWRGIGRPKREWQPGPLIVERPELRRRMAQAATQGPTEEFHAKATILSVPRKRLWVKIAALFRRLFRV